MSWGQLPEELRKLNQWVGSKADKKPLDVKTGFAASVDNPKTWATFEQACASGLPHIGFVFTKNDPYTFIDLDTGKKPELINLHAEIVEQADSYTETSISGTGSHIVLKGALPSGLRDDNKAIEIYPHGRFMLATGWKYHGHGIEEGQVILDYLSGMIGKNRLDVKELTSSESGLSDEELIQKARNAENGDKFDALFTGGWQDYPEYAEDHSRADLALTVFLDFYSKDVNQVLRVFMASALYRPTKGRASSDGSDYILRTIKQARARNDADTPPEVDATELLERAEKVQAEAIAKTPPPPPPGQPAVLQNGVPFPPGLVGGIAEYIYTSATRPVREVALMGALAMTAGIVGRQFNIPGSGLNLYLILLAPTGTGKEGASSGISKLIAKIRETVPAADQFIGPADFASGPALIKALDNQPCLFSILGEFGLRIQQMADPRSNGAEKTLQKALLNLYSKSGWHQVESSLAYSDREKNTSTLFAPCLTIFGETTPETFFAKLTDEQVTSGLLPRFAFLEYKGLRPPRNTISAYCDPHPALVDRLADLTSTVIQMQANSSCHNVVIDSTAQQVLDQFDSLCDERINKGSEVYKQLWNRAHLKALRLAAVVAVGCNHHSPVVNKELAEWAVDFVKKDVGTIETRFLEEDIGEGEHRHEAEVRKAILYYLNLSKAKRETFKVSKKIIDEQIIPYAYLRRRLRQLATFKNDRRGPSLAIQFALKDACEAGIIQLIPPLQRKEKYNLTADLYIIGESW